MICAVQEISKERLGYLIKDINAKIVQKRIEGSGCATIAKDLEAYWRTMAAKVRPVKPSSQQARWTSCGFFFVFHRLVTCHILCTSKLVPTTFCLRTLLRVQDVVWFSWLIVLSQKVAPCRQHLLGHLMKDIITEIVPQRIAALGFATIRVRVSPLSRRRELREGFVLHLLKYDCVVWGHFLCTSTTFLSQDLAPCRGFLCGLGDGQCLRLKWFHATFCALWNFFPSLGIGTVSVEYLGSKMHSATLLDFLHGLVGHGLHIDVTTFLVHRLPLPQWFHDEHFVLNRAAVVVVLLLLFFFCISCFLFFVGLISLHMKPMWCLNHVCMVSE